MKGQGDRQIQIAAVILIVFFISLITYQIAAEYFGIVMSLIFSALTVFGTLVGPTVGGGLWSIDLDILVTGLVMLRIIRGQYGKYVHDCILGILLFCGYLIRPGFSLFILGTFTILYLLHKRAFIRTAITSAVLFVGFVGWSLVNYHSYLPPYYEQFSKLSIHAAGTAFLALLLSPSRSIFIYSPITLALILIPFVVRRWRGEKRIIIMSYLFVCLGWFLLNIVWPMWWGGASYGPRILTNMSYLSALIVIVSVGLVRPERKGTVLGSLCLSRNTMKCNEKKSLQPAWHGVKWWPFSINVPFYTTYLVLCLILFIVGVPIALEGMYNPASVAWNGVPASNGSLQDRAVWVWQYPQWMMTSGSLYKMCIAEGKMFHVRCGMLPLPVSFQSQLTQVAALRAAAACYLAHGGSLSALTPDAAIADHCLNVGYASVSQSNSQSDNWTVESGWLGPQGQDVGIGIGTTGTVARKVFERLQEIHIQATTTTGAGTQSGSAGTTSTTTGVAGSQGAPKFLVYDPNPHPVTLQTMAHDPQGTYLMVLSPYALRGYYNPTGAGTEPATGPPDSNGSANLNGNGNGS